MNNIIPETEIITPIEIRPPKKKNAPKTMHIIPDKSRFSRGFFIPSPNELR
jgi:hypothetical protein